MATLNELKTDPPLQASESKQDGTHSSLDPEPLPSTDQIVSTQNNQQMYVELKSIVFRFGSIHCVVVVLMLLQSDDADDEKFHFTLPSLDDAQCAMFRISNQGTKSGYGLIAECDIERGTVILREKPLIVIPEYVSSQKNAAIQWIQQQFDELSEREKSIFQSLCISTELEHDQNALWKISKTNGIALPQRNAKGVFPLISRVNHSYESNVGWIWMEELNEERLVAHCDIKKGSELLACYVLIENDRDQRQHRLKMIWNIDECVDEEKELVFKEYKELNDAMESMVKDPIKALKAAKRCIEISEKYLKGKVYEHYYDAAQFSMGLQRWSEAAYYLDTSMKEKRMVMGGDVVMDDLFKEKVQILPDKFRRKFKKYETPGKIQKEVKVAAKNVKVAAKKKQNPQKNQKKKQNKKNQQKKKKQKKRKNRR